MSKSNQLKFQFHRIYMIFIYFKIFERIDL